MKTNKLTEGPILTSLLSLSIPIVVANILQTMYQLVDTFWVGRLGADAIAAVSITFPIIFLLIALGGGLTIAGSVLVAQYKGAKNYAKVDHISAQTLLIMILISFVLTIFGYFSSSFLVSLMGAETSVAADASAYLQISFLGMIFLFGYFVFQSLMRGVGDVKTPMIIVLGTVLLNLILDPIFIMGYGPIPGFGVAGAAIVTVLTQGLAAIIGLTMLFSGKYDVRLHLKDFKPDFVQIKKIFAIGVPASAEQTTVALGLAVMIILVSSFGTDAVAAYGIGTRILSFIIIPAVGLSIATSTLVGQNIGAKKIERAERLSHVSAGVSLVVLTILGIILYFLAEPISAFFVPGETKVIQTSAHFIRIMAMTFGFFGVQQTYAGSFRGAGNTLAAMVIAFVALWVLRFPAAYILSRPDFLGEDGLWWSFPISNVISGIMAYLWFIQGNWKNHPMVTESLSAKVSEETLIEEAGVK
ncbi:MAG: MATE family efflux transporter [Candidatus Peregrinibacteria bacterium]|nr:MATE family efflux transporter [Candidatus Peregrinibacteria bacterium]MDZ4244803.1 MATE family efflux transporter [Candidatus Gracilibacteria bacterium]